MPGPDCLSSARSRILHTIRDAVARQLVARALSVCLFIRFEHEFRYDHLVPDHVLDKSSFVERAAPVWNRPTAAPPRERSRLQEPQAALGDVSLIQLDSTLGTSAVSYIASYTSDLSPYFTSTVSLEIDNSSERPLCGIALGRKSWLFAGSDRGGERAAVMYTLIDTAKLNDVDPQAWLADILARIADLPQTRLIRSGETSTPYSSLRWPRISRTLMPRAYIEITLSSKPSIRLWPLRTILGSNEALRSWARRPRARRPRPSAAWWNGRCGCCPSRGRPDRSSRSPGGRSARRKAPSRSAGSSGKLLGCSGDGRTCTAPSSGAGASERAVVSAAMIDNLRPLVQQGTLSLLHGSYLLRPGRGRIIVQPARP